MGKGKGSVDRYVCPVKPGMILFEVDNVSREQAFAAFTKVASKLPVSCIFVERGKRRYS